MSKRRGYILVEAVTAMAILSIAAVTVQRAVQTAVQARGLARDYTSAEFLLERISADCTLEPRIAAGEVHEGTFPAPWDRFSYRWMLEKIELPLPELPGAPSPEQTAALASKVVDHMGKLHIEIAWVRGGEPFSVAADTLLSPEQTWISPMESGR